MSKKTWSSAEIIVLGVENTEANIHYGTVRDGEYCQYDPDHKLPLYS